jgi:hypothetical protein
VTATTAWRSAATTGPQNPQEINRYSYALNNPMRYNDPSGHVSDPLDEKAGGGGGGGPGGGGGIGGGSGGRGGIAQANVSSPAQPVGQGTGGTNQRVEPYNITAHGKQPTPRDPLQSHHIIQDEWAKAHPAMPSGQTYNSRQAPSILLEKGNASHSIVTTRQNMRRDVRVDSGQERWSSTLREEFNNASQDLRAAGVPDAARKRAIKSAYKYFYGE